MSLKSRITDIARHEAEMIVNGRISVLQQQSQSCNITGRITKADVKDGTVVFTVLLPDGTTTIAQANTSSHAVGPGSTVLVINGFIIL